MMIIPQVILTLDTSLLETGRSSLKTLGVAQTLQDMINVAGDIMAVGIFIFLIMTTRLQKLFHMNLMWTPIQAPTLTQVQK